MDVVSLYPNIDQEEGAEACERILEERRTQSIPSSIVKKLILLVLRSHTMNFCGRFFHQLKGTAMGTSMAVNFANCFMSIFETQMLQEYASTYGHQPALWLRYIDDVFFVWKGTKASLDNFINFCDNYSTAKGMASNIHFTSSYSTKSVNFLDVTVKQETDGRLSTNIYSKPTAAHQYLHATSYHEPHSIKSIPKSQFIRIRRICTHISDYWTAAREFTNYFASRGYKREQLVKTANEVAQFDRNRLLNKQAAPQSSSQNRIPLVLTWHHKFAPFSKILHEQYAKAAQSQVFKKTFPEPPIIAYRRAKNFSDKLIRANHRPKPANQQQYLHHKANYRD